MLNRRRFLGLAAGLPLLHGISSLNRTPERQANNGAGWYAGGRCGSGSPEPNWSLVVAPFGRWAEFQAGALSPLFRQLRASLQPSQGYQFACRRTPARTLEATTRGSSISQQRPAEISFGTVVVDPSDQAAVSELERELGTAPHFDVLLVLARQPDRSGNLRSVAGTGTWRRVLRRFHAVVWISDDRWLARRSGDSSGWRPGQAETALWTLLQSFVPGTFGVDLSDILAAVNGAEFFAVHASVITSLEAERAFVCGTNWTQPFDDNGSVKVSGYPSQNTLAPWAAEVARSAWTQLDSSIAGLGAPDSALLCVSAPSKWVVEETIAAAREFAARCTQHTNVILQAIAALNSEPVLSLHALVGYRGLG